MSKVDYEFCYAMRRYLVIYIINKAINRSLWQMTTEEYVLHEQAQSMYS